MEIENLPGEGVSIVPLHMGYIQDGAQNHALCSSGFISAGQKRMFKDACCVQQSQGGYLGESQQWFFILPLPLRNEALKLRGTENYGKLWPAISQFNKKLGLPERGHLEQIISKKKAYLTQFQSRFEVMPEQTGALFFIGDKMVGIEIAPSAEYFREVWVPLVCFCYGTAAMYFEGKDSADVEQPKFTASDLAGLRDELNASRKENDEKVKAMVTETPKEHFSIKEEERYLELRLNTALGEYFSGQYVTSDGRMVYASIAATPDYFYSGN